MNTYLIAHVILGAENQSNIIDKIEATNELEAMEKLAQKMIEHGLDEDSQKEFKSYTDESDYGVEEFIEKLIDWDIMMSKPYKI